jgi:O-acetyl-ADP-ribose deacetylase (regulator of RNase III)
MSAWRVDRVVIEVVVGNIVEQPDIDAIVNAANAQLRTGGGVAGAIHRAAGPGLELECRPLAPLRVGTGVLTGGHDLPNRHVIHVLGPVYGRDEPADVLLASCYRVALDIADRNGLESIALPAISTGAFGFPLGPAASIAIATVVAAAPGLAAVRRVRFVLYDEPARSAFESELRSRANA